jgi:hypothetical protein
MFMFALLVEGHRDDTLSHDDQIGIIARNVLPLIRPHLSGLVAQHIADLVEHPDTPLHQRPIC